MESKVKFGGTFYCKIIGKDGQVKDAWSTHNLVPDAGLNAILNVMFGETSAPTDLYVGLLGNYTPVAGTTITQLASNEVTAYSETNRRTYTPNGATSTKSISNSASPATFTCNANATQVYGAFLATSLGKSANTGYALCAAQFASVKTLDSGDELVVTYVFGAADDNA